MRIMRKIVLSEDELAKAVIMYVGSLGRKVPDHAALDFRKTVPLIKPGPEKWVGEMQWTERAEDEDR